ESPSAQATRASTAPARPIAAARRTLADGRSGDATAVGVRLLCVVMCHLRERRPAQRRPPQPPESAAPAHEARFPTRDADSWVYAGTSFPVSPAPSVEFGSVRRRR